MNTQYSISTEEFEMIEQYLLDKIAPAEKLSFEKQIQTDDLLAAKVKEVKLLLEGIDAAVLKERLNTYHLKIKPGNTQKKVLKSSHLKCFWLHLFSSLLYFQFGFLQ